MDLITLINKAETRLSQLHPEVALKARQLIEIAYANGYEIIITQGYRSIAEQNELYAQGRTKLGNIVTNAKGGQSNHNYRVAFDIAILLPDGDIDWDSHDKYTAVGHMGESLSLEWGGSWQFVDEPHFEYTFGYSIQDFQNGASLPYFDNNVLKRGFFYDTVTQLQNKLIQLGYQLTPNGYFCGATDWCVRDFQSKAGLSCDGEVGKITMAAIDKKVMELEVIKMVSKYFKDPDMPDWIAASADDLHEKGLLSGKQLPNGDVVVDWNTPITRGEMAVLLDRVVNFLLQHKG